MKNLIEQGYIFIQEDKLLNAVMVCLRISRKINDYLNTAIFLREISNDKDSYEDILFREIYHLKRDQSKYIYDKSLEKWIKERTLPDTDNNLVYPKGIGELEADLKIFEASISDFRTPQGMHPLDIAHFEDSNKTNRAHLRNSIRELYTIKERIRTRCLNYLITIEKQIEAQQKQSNSNLELIHQVNNYFKSTNKDIYNKLFKICELAKEDDSESSSLLLTEIRRSISSISDFLYPPEKKEVICSDGIKRNLGKENYLNRIQEYIKTNIQKSTSRELLLLEFDNFDKIIRKLNELSSKGVHDNVTNRESKQCMYSFYSFCANLIFSMQINET